MSRSAVCSPIPWGRSFSFCAGSTKSKWLRCPSSRSWWSSPTVATSGRNSPGWPDIVRPKEPGRPCTRKIRMKKAEPSLRFKIAGDNWEFEAVHRLNYKTFVEEIPQHARNPDQRLVDKFHAENI